MFHTFTTPNLGKTLASAAKSAFSMLLRAPRQIFIAGPRVLLTSRITGKCAALMALLLAPSLLCFAILSLPSVLFRSPEQHAYYYFAEVLDHDTNYALPLTLAVLCMLIALAIPASMPRQRLSVSY